MQRIKIAIVAVALASMAGALWGQELSPEARWRWTEPLKDATPAVKDSPSVPASLPILDATPKPVWPAGFQPLKWTGSRWVSADGKWTSGPGGKWVAVVKPAAKLSIPSPRRTWTHPGNTKAALINHLLTNSYHSGHFTRAQLEQLSYGDLERLHSADHDGLVASTAPAQASGRWVMKRFCGRNGCVWRRVWEAY